MEGVLPHACPGTATQRTTTWGMTASNSFSPFWRPKSERWGASSEGSGEPPYCSPFRKFQGCEDLCPGTGTKAKDYFYYKSQYHIIKTHRALCSNVFPEKPACQWDWSWGWGGLEGCRADAPPGSGVCKCIWSPARPAEVNQARKRPQLILPPSSNDGHFLAPSYLKQSSPPLKPT